MTVWEQTLTHLLCNVELQASLSCVALHREGGPVLGVEATAVESMGHNINGFLQWSHMPNAMHMKSGLFHVGDWYSTAVVLQLGIPNTNVSARATVNVFEHTQLECSIEVTTRLYVCVCVGLSWLSSLVEGLTFVLPSHTPNAVWSS
jgi:hypothetical protein